MEPDEDSGTCDNNNRSGARSTTPIKKLKIRGEYKSAKKRTTTYCYNEKWQEKYSFVTSSNKGRIYARCKVCDVHFKADITIVRNHEKSKDHLKHLSTIKGQKKIYECKKSSTEFENEVFAAEIRLTGFLSEHNVPFLAIEHLVDLIKDIFKDSKIAQNLNLKRTKATQIVKNVIAPIEKEQLVEKLKSTKFSVMVDESTDVASKKTLCVNVRYFDQDEKKIVSKFFDLIQISKMEGDVFAGATAEKLYGALIAAFSSCNIPFSNIIGFGSDGCNTMMGAKGGLKAKFEHDMPGIIVQKCICHSLHLAASEACKVLPRKLEDLARDIYNFFKSSDKKQSELLEFQEFCQVEPHKILRPSQTRWLSLNSVIKRILEQWEPLKLYFTDKASELRLLSVETIYNALHDPITKLFYLFLEWVLEQVSSTNAYFQSEKVVIAAAHSKMINLYKDLLKAYMNNVFVEQKFATLNPEDSSQFVFLRSMYMPIKVKLLLDKNKYCNELVEDFYQRCRHFVIVLCSQIKKRYDFSCDNIQSQIGKIHPSHVLQKNSSVTSLFDIMKLTPRIIDINNVNLLQTIDNEWRCLRNCDISSFNIESDEEVDKFWFHISQIKNEGNQYLFKNLSEYCLSLLSIPHSNATCERVFSKVNLIKTKLRNKLITNTVCSLLLTSQHITMNNGNCTNFIPNFKMLKFISNSSILYKSENKPESSDCDSNDHVIFDEVTDE